MQQYLHRDGDEGRPLVKAPSARTCPIKWAQLNWSVMYLWTLDSICEKRFFHSFTITQNMPWNTRNIDNLSLKYWPSDFCSLLNLSHPDGSLLGQGWIIFTGFMAINLVIIRKAVSWAKVKSTSWQATQYFAPWRSWSSTHSHRGHSVANIRYPWLRKRKVSSNVAALALCSTTPLTCNLPSIWISCHFAPSLQPAPSERESSIMDMPGSQWPKVLLLSTTSLWSLNR